MINPVIESEERRERHSQRIVKLLRKKGRVGATNLELNGISLAYTAIITILRGKGYEITTEYKPEIHGEGVYNYILEKCPAKESAQLNATDITLSIVESCYGGTISTKNLKKLLQSMNMIIVRKPGTYKLKNNSS